MSSPKIHPAHPPAAAIARVSPDIIAKSLSKVCIRALCHPLPSSWVSLHPCWPFYQDHLFLHVMSKLYFLNVLKLFLHCTTLPLLFPGVPDFSPTFVPLVVIFPECKIFQCLEVSLPFPHLPRAPQSLVNLPNHK